MRTKTVLCGLFATVLIGVAATWAVQHWSGVSSRGVSASGSAGAEVASAASASAASASAEAAGGGDEPPVPRAAPRDTRFDFGTVLSGTKVASSFEIRNEGQLPLQISASSDCGCAAVTSDSTIEPGAVGEIKVRLDTSRLQGEVRKLVVVTTNDLQRRQIPLVLTGTVKPAVEILPQASAIVPLGADGPTQYEWTLRPRASDGVRITGVHSNQPFVELALVPAEVESIGEEARLIATFRPDAPWGEATTVITVNTTSALHQQLQIIVRSEKGIVVSQSSLGFSGGRRGPDASLARVALLRKREGKFQIRSAASSDPNLQVEIVPIKDGLIYKLIATYRGELTKLSGKGVVTVETDDPQQPRLEIPIRSAVRTAPSKASGG